MGRLPRQYWVVLLGCVVLISGGVLFLEQRSAKPVLTREMALEALNRVEGRFYVGGETNAFSGFVLEHYENGVPKSRTAVRDGLLDGFSEGWYPNGQLQVQEFFVQGVAHGRKTKWWKSGQMLSDGEVVDGEWEGLFRKWHENGQLSQEIPMKRGKAHGVAKAWFESGALKSRVEMAEGEIVKSEYFEEPNLSERSEQTQAQSMRERSRS